MSDETDRKKKPGENHLQWQTRIAQFDQILRAIDGPVLTGEAERNGNFRDDFVMHIETMTLARTKRRADLAGLRLMLERGQINDELFSAAEEIAAVVELIRRDVSVRGASLDARVDNSGSAKGILIERLAAVRAQVAFTAWRSRLPIPRVMIVDMLTLPQSMTRQARKHGMDWPKARKRLIRALEDWLQIKERVWASVDEDDVNSAYRRLGEGELL